MPAHPRKTSSKVSRAKPQDEARAASAGCLRCEGKLVLSLAVPLQEVLVQVRAAWRAWQAQHPQRKVPRGRRVDEDSALAQAARTLVGKSLDRFPSGHDRAKQIDQWVSLPATVNTLMRQLGRLDEGTDCDQETIRRHVKLALIDSMSVLALLDPTCQYRKFLRARQRGTERLLEDAPRVLAERATPHLNALLEQCDKTAQRYFPEEWNTIPPMRSPSLQEFTRLLGEFRRLYAAARKPQPRTSPSTRSAR